MLQKALSFLEENQDYFLKDVIELIRIPSISPNPAYQQQIQNAAEWLANKFTRIGMDNVQIIPTRSNPLVYAEWLHAGPGKPTLLFYGHYDVIPPEPLEDWKSDPFEPIIKDGNIYARGTNDDKCQLYSFVGACESYLRTSGKLPVNVKFLLEGAEELGSEGMEAALLEHHRLFECDAAVVVDGAFMNPETPTIGAGSRGLVYAEVFLTGPARDLHSGNYGGIIHNPIQAAAEIVARLHDENCRVTIPGFYDRVVKFSDAEIQATRKLEAPREFYENSLGVPALWGEPGYSVLERLGMRPTLEIHGIGGGFSGEGHKTVIPAQAVIKVSMRIVPNQDPLEIYDLFKDYIAQITPPTVHSTVNLISHCDSSSIDINSPFLYLAEVCYKQGYGYDPVIKRGGGSLAVLGLFQKILSVPVLSLGLGLPDDGLHSPNEKFSLAHFYKGIKGMISMLDAAQKIPV